jgi:hypothetical protein
MPNQYLFHTQISILETSYFIDVRTADFTGVFPYA